ncbi:MAG: HEAT repeat domain-containing protein [Terriglobales bacterium]|jgi:hypothetical protein
MKYQFLRNAFLSAVLIYKATIPIFGQQTPLNMVQATVRKLRSNDGAVRAEAFEQLRSDPANLKNQKVRAALVNLLDRENRTLDAQLVEAQKKGYPDNGDNAGWAEYYSDLFSTVDSFADWNDPRQACILVNAGSSDDSAFASEVAHHAKVTIPCLMRKSESTVSMNRAITVPILVQALAKADSLDPGTAQAVRQIVRDALNDRDEGVRAFTVHALGEYGEEDMIPALRTVAETDSSSEVRGNSIKRAAAEAVTAIQKRAAQH